MDEGDSSICEALAYKHEGLSGISPHPMVLFYCCWWLCVCVCVNWSMVAHTCVSWLGRQKWLGIPHRKRPLLHIGEGAWPYCSHQSA